MMRLSTLMLASVAALSGARHAGAQTSRPAPAESLTLRRLYDEVARADPRQRQLALQSRATDLRLRNIDAEQRPSIAVDGQAQLQSSVTRVPVSLPGVSITTPSRDTYDAHLGLQQSVFDPATSARRGVERAQLVESQAQIRATLFASRQEINDAFFAAAVVEQRLAELDGAIGDLSARLREAADRFRQGAALPGDTAAVAAALLQREQDRLQLRATRTAALARLSDLVGRPIGAGQTLVVTDEAAAVATAIVGLDTLRARPEYAQFAAARDRLARQYAVEASQDKPRVSAFGRLGYGRPGLNVLSRDFQSYWIGGMQVHWAPWTWGNEARDREINALQQEIITTNEEEFARGLRRSVEQTMATITYLDSALVLDDRIVALRERIDTEMRAKLREGVVTAADYVEKRNDVLTARLLRIQHGVELAQARATFLTTLGLEVP